MDDPRAAARPRRRRGRAEPGRRPRNSARHAACSRGRARLREHRPLHRRACRSHQSERTAAGRSQPSRVARAAQARPVPRGAAGPRFCDSGRRQGRGRAGPRAPLDVEARALGAADQRRRHRARDARAGADALGRRGSANTRVTETVRYATPKLGGYVVLIALGLLASLIFARPELALIAVPFAVLLAVGLSLARQPDVRVHVEVDRGRVLEGEEVRVEFELDARDSASRLELLVEIPRGLELVEGRNPLALRLGLGEERELELRLRCARWGAYRLGEVHLRATDAAGLFAWEQT